MFQKISLADIGHIQYLGHHGKPCSPISQEEFGAWEDDNQMDLDDLADLTGPEETYTQILVVGTSGISNHHFHFCTCPNAASEVEQLAEARLFPASYNKIRTTFTFQVLDDYLLESIVCKISAHAFWSKLQRKTNNAFPSDVPVSIDQYCNFTDRDLNSY
jgi:hypothetical protein